MLMDSHYFTMMAKNKAKVAFEVYAEYEFCKKLRLAKRAKNMREIASDLARASRCFAALCSEQAKEADCELVEEAQKAAESVSHIIIKLV